MKDLEFNISQYLDGTLSPQDRLALERQIAVDAEARVMLEEYRRLDVAMKSMPLPKFAWDAVAASLAAAVDAADAQRAIKADGKADGRSYRMAAWVRASVMPLALAASLLIAVGVGFEVYNSRQRPSGWDSTRVGVRAVSPSMVVAFETDKASGPVVENVAIGPSAAVMNNPLLVHLGADDAATASHVTIVSGIDPGHDIRPASSFDME